MKSPTSSRRRGGRRKTPRHPTPRQLPVINANAAGIDVAATADLWVAAPPDREEESVRSFSPMSHGLEALVDWLQQMGVSSVAMESTGVYWVALYTMLREAGIEVVLVNARDVRRLKPKSDIADCQWLQYLHSVGLLKGSFVPPPDICALRAIARQRERLLREAAWHLQHAQQALDEMNLHLHHVLDDLGGTSGQSIIGAILEGERDPEKLAALCHRNVRTPRAIIAQALTGRWREDQLFVLRQAHESCQRVQGQIAVCDERLWQMAGGLEVRLKEQELPVPPPSKQRGRPRKSAAGPASDKTRGSQRRKGRSRNAPANQDEWSAKLHALFGVDLTLVPGISVLTVLTLLVELGTDWRAFQSGAHFASWLGLCPHNDRSGKKILRRRTDHGQSRLKALLRMCAQSLWQSHSHLGDQYRRLKARLGPAAANTAMAHKLARILWHLVSHQVAYDETLMAQLDHHRHHRQTQRLRNQAKRLGFELTPLKQAA